MILDLEAVVTRIADQTGYACAIAKEEKPVLHRTAELPQLFIGYIGERPTSEVSPFNARSVEGFAGFDEEFMEIITVGLVSTMAGIVKHKTKMRDALLGWSPNPTDESSTFVSLGGTILSVSNGRVYYSHDFAITYPTL